MWRYLKVHAIYNTCIVRCLLTQNRRDGVLDLLPIHIPGVGALLGAADSDILPEPSPLCARQRLPLAACNDIIRNRRFFHFFQTIDELRRNWDCPLCRFCFQLGCHDRAVVFDVPGTANDDVRRSPIQEYAIPLQCEGFFSAQARIQAEHNKRIWRQTAHRVQEGLHLLCGERRFLFRRFAAFWIQILARRFVDDFALLCRCENQLVQHLDAAVDRRRF